MSGGQTPQEIDTAMEQIVDGHRGLLEEIDTAKVEPVRIERGWSYSGIAEKKTDGTTLQGAP